MQVYYYTLMGNCNILQDIISLDDILRPLIINIQVSTNMDGSVATDNVMVTANVVLDSTQEDALIAVINGYMTNPLKARRMIEDNTMQPAMSFGMEFLKKFSANNVYLGKTSAQIDALLAAYPDLIHACLTGSLLSLYATMLSMTASANISQDEIDEFTKRIQIYLGII